MLIRNERKGQDNNMENVAAVLKSEMESLLSTAEKWTAKTCMDRKLNELLEEDFPTHLDFYVQKQELLRNSFFADSYSLIGGQVYLCVDNPSLVNGGIVQRLDREKEWYRRLKELDRKAILCFYYDEADNVGLLGTKRIVFVREMDYFYALKKEKLVRVDLDYQLFYRMLPDLYDSMPIYVCSGGKVLFSNQDSLDEHHDFEEMQRRGACQLDFELYGMPIQIQVMSPAESVVLRTFQKNGWILLLLFLLSMLVPFLIIILTNRSFTKRLRELSDAFRAGEEEGKFVDVEHVRGKDEIGHLMRSYNQLARQNRNLIETIYETRLREQETVLEKQNAELLALRMQVNPHFLFNMLESIRMYGLVNKENRVAEMIEKLAILERQAVDWTSDRVTVEEEMKFVENYLSLQSFRFGERFSYSVDVEEGCRGYLVPKLTISTFVENACVHGTGSKLTQTRIFLTVARVDEGHFAIEIEDTSGGMSEEKVEAIKKQMENCSIDMLRNSKHTGVVNACLRLKMMTDGDVKFELESEEGYGTYIRIILPCEGQCN